MLNNININKININKLVKYFISIYIIILITDLKTILPQKHVIDIMENEYTKYLIVLIIILLLTNFSMYYLLIIFIIIIIIINCGKAEVQIKYNKINVANHDVTDEPNNDTVINNRIIDTNATNNSNEISKQNESFENFDNIRIHNMYYKDISDKAADFVIDVNKSRVK